MDRVYCYSKSGNYLWDDFYMPEEWCAGCQTGEVGGYCGGCVGCMIGEAEWNGCVIKIIDDLDDTLGTKSIWQFDLLKEIGLSG